MRIGNPFKRFRLGILFTSMFGGIMAIFLIILMVVSYQTTSSYMSKQVSQNQQELLNEVGRRVDTKMTSIEQMALSITRNETLLNYLGQRSDDLYTKQLTQKQISLYLSNIVYSWDSVLDSIQVYMNDPVHTSGLPAAFLDTQNLPAEDWYPLIEQSDFTWIAERHGGEGSTEDKVISFVQKIYSDSNQSIGVLVFNVKMSTVQSTLLNSDNLNQGVKRVLLGSGQQMITSAGFSAEDEPHLHEFVQNYFATEDYLNGQRVDFNQPHFVTESGDRNARWTVIQFTPWKVISEDSLRIALMLGSIGIVAVIIVFFFIFFLSRQFMKPLLILKQAMDRFSADMHRSQLPRDYSNEFNILFRGYDTMMERVIDLYAKMEKQYIKQKELDVKALQAMINPHFLYNTLDQINWMAIEANQPRISQMLELVGKMFRIGLSNGDTIVTVREEIAYIHSYLKIQQIRMSPRILNVSILLPPELEQYYMPKLLLQPFVENSVMHGLHGRSTGLIEINVTDHKDGIAFIIQDNGNGFQTKAVSEHRTHVGGYGIRNVRERIEALFGDPYGISIKTEPDQVVIVTIVIPKRDKSDFYS